MIVNEYPPAERPIGSRLAITPRSEVTQVSFDLWAHRVRVRYRSLRRAGVSAYDARLAIYDALLLAGLHHVEQYIR